jgi:iron complex outermembrane receptor protein
MKNPKRTVFRKAPLALACAAATLVSGYVTAQESNLALEEVIVTATKRSESLQDVAMSITALGGDDLERIGATTLLDFAVKVPNLGMAYEADGRFDSSSPSIRGVFGKDTTGFYIDDTPVNASVLPRIMDVQRVEVLRGPQGSLYGARSMGGTIRMITKQPDLTNMDGTVHASVSTVDDGDENGVVDGSINIPIVEDVFAIRASAYYGENSGIYDRVYDATYIDGVTGPTANPAPNFGTNENVDDENYWGGQLIALWQITDNFSFTPKLIGQKVEADGFPMADIEPDNEKQLRHFNTKEDGSDEWYIGSGTFNWEIGAGDIVSTTSWFDRKTDETEDEETFLNQLLNQVIGFSVVPLEAPISTIEEYTNLTHETRFTSSFEGNWQVTAGIFYSDGKWDHEYPGGYQVGLYDAVLANGVPPEAIQDCGPDGLCIQPNDLIFSTTSRTDVEELALFGEVTWAFTDRWALTAGGRYYQTDLEFKSVSDGFAVGGPSSNAQDQDESGFNPKVMLEWAATDDINVYASAAKGFRIGGVNGKLPQGLCGDELNEKNIDPSAVETFDSDELWSYELGFKSTLANNRVTLNGAAYWIDWTEMQNQNRLACGFQFIDNVGEAESKGFELEMHALITDGLTGTIGVGYTDAEITDDGGASNISKGDTILGVPDWTGNASLEYLFPMGSSEGMVRADANYYGESTTAPTGTVVVRDDWTLLNLRAGMIRDSWEVILFADNVTDERANLSDNRSIAANTDGRPRVITNRPRTLGVEARWRF